MTNGPPIQLVGRRNELAEIAAHLDAALAGRGGLVLVAGEPGMGKTHLLDEAIRDATERGAGAVVARCWEGQGSLPLRIWTPVMRELSMTGLLPDPELARVLAEGPSINGLLGDVDPAGARVRLFDRAVTALRQAADAEPLLIVLDDLQWADRSSLELLAAVASGSRQSPLAVIGAYRDAEVPEALAELLATLPADTARITLHGLPPVDVATLAGTICGFAVDADVAAALTARTGGNPFFVRELVRLLAAQGRLGNAAGMPAGVAQVLSRRLARLSPACRAVLGAGSVIGSVFDADLVAAITDERRDDLLDRCDEAIAARVLVETGPQQFRFVHDLFREAVYDGLGRTHRLLLHRAAGEAIERRHAGEVAPHLGALGPHLGALAHHFLAAAPIGDAAKAVDYGRRAGQRAAGMLAYDEAARWFRRATHADPAMAAGDRARLLVALGDAVWRDRDLAGARAVLAEAMELAREVDDPTVFADAALAYGGGLGGNQPLASADTALIALLEEALARLPTADSVLRCRVISRLAVELYLTGEAARRAALSELAVEMARRLGDARSMATALYARQIAMFGPDSIEDRQAAVDEMLALADEAGDLELSLWGHLFRCWVLAEQCAPTDAELAVCAELADRLDLPGYRAEVALRQAVNLLVAGRFGAAEGLMTTVAAGQSSDLAPATTQAALAAMVATLKGPHEELAELVDAIVREQPDKAMWRAGLIVVNVELGRFDDASRDFEMIAATGFEFPRDGLWLTAMHCVGFACFALGAADHAATLCDTIGPHVDRAPVGSFGSMATPFGLVNAAAGRFDEALRWLDTGYRRNLAVGNRAYALWTRRETAAVLIARGDDGDRQRAATILADVISEVRSTGFDGFVARAAWLAAQAGERPVANSTISTVPAAAELRRRHDGWSACYDGKAVDLPPLRGIDDLAVLLARPAREVAAVDLAGAVAATDTGVLLDERARRDLRSRVVDLEEEIVEAEDFNDSGRAERARAERDTLVSTL
ncbi:MAG: ATP-binding protein, partial [Acidimicrobiales bacterium]